MLTPQQRLEWEHAQEAEKEYWYGCGIDDPDGSTRRQLLVDSESQKADFIFNQMVDHFGVDPAKDWSKLKVLDVGCGPTSLVARSKFGKTRAGVDPLAYPKWVYEDYKKHGFKVFLQPFEELDTTKKFDIIIFYNALQHFANLGEVARKCREVLAKGGKIYLSEYLEVPTNHAHIHYLESAKLDGLFEGAGFEVESVNKQVRLPGLVELPGGQPIGLYIASLRMLS